MAAGRRRTLETPGHPPPDFNPDETRVIRPRPGGRRAPASTQTASTQTASPDTAAPQASALQTPAPTTPAPPSTPEPVPDPPTTPGDAGVSMLPFAMPLLQLLARLRTLAGDADPAALRDRTEDGLRQFATRATAAGIPPDLVRRGQYALADSLDDAALNTPWGARSAWAAHGMVASLHPGIGPGRFFDALRQAQARPEQRPVLELMALCLALGMAGPYRTQPGGTATLDALRAEANAALLAGAPPAPDTLASDWRGVDMPAARRRVRLPLWVAASAGLAAVGGLFLLLDASVNTDGDALFARLLAAPPAQMPAIAREPAAPLPPPPPPVEPTAADRIRARLAATGPITVAGTPAIPVLRLPERALFAPDSATLLPGAAAVLGAAAAALRPEGGRIRVVGYADNRAVRTVAFPSAFKLTAARAEAVRAGLSLTPATAEGRGPADPLAPNTTPEGRAENRRIEIVLEGAPP